MRKSILSALFLASTLAIGVAHADDGDGSDGGQDTGPVATDDGGSNGGTDVVDGSGSGDGSGSVTITIGVGEGGYTGGDAPGQLTGVVMRGPIVMDHAAPPGDFHLVAIDPLPGDTPEGKAASLGMKTAMAMGAKDAPGKKK